VDLFGGGGRRDGGHAAADDQVLARRVAVVVDWLAAVAPLLPIGLAASGKGAAIALRAAAMRPDLIGALVVRGGRPDLAGDVLDRVVAPTLLVVGGRDAAFVGLNRRALARLGGPKQIVVAPASSQAFEGPGRLDFVSRLAATWFSGWLAPKTEAPRAAQGGI
jgi:putative phosphoribosyl transferase